MPTFVYMTRCDGCGHCVDICPSDIMHIDKVTRRAYNIEPNMCWECYSCVKACPHNAIDVRGYADFAPLGHSVRVIRDEEKGVIAWRIKFRNGKKGHEPARADHDQAVGQAHPSARRRASADARTARKPVACSTSRNTSEWTMVTFTPSSPMVSN
jgi:adenosine phosphosulfate reductase beta subunit